MLVEKIEYKEVIVTPPNSCKYYSMLRKDLNADSTDYGFGNAVWMHWYFSSNLDQTVKERERMIKEDLKNQEKYPDRIYEYKIIELELPI